MRDVTTRVSLAPERNWEGAREPVSGAEEPASYHHRSVAASWQGSRAASAKVMRAREVEWVTHLCPMVGGRATNYPYQAAKMAHQ